MSIKIVHPFSKSSENYYVLNVTDCNFSPPMTAKLSSFSLKIFPSSSRSPCVFHANDFAFGLLNKAQRK